MTAKVIQAIKVPHNVLSHDFLALKISKRKCTVHIGFLEKNRDTLSNDVIQLIHISSNKLLKQIFHNELSITEAKTSSNHIIVTPKNSLRVC